MPNEPIRLLDPEAVIPSPQNSYELEFWMRMLKFAGDREPRVGPSTMRALQLLIQSPPKVNGLPDGDFWAIIGRFISRGFVPSTSKREVCEKHLQEVYTPIMGAEGNVQLLIQDMESAGAARRVAIDTVEDVWLEDHLPYCPACDRSGTSYLFRPNGDSLDSAAMAPVWRKAYMDEHPSDFTQLETFAPQMFPYLEFSEDAWKRLKSLSGSPEDITASLMHHLSVLNDNASHIWGNNHATEGRQSAMGALGVACSLEGPRIHKDKKAMKARDFRFTHGIVRCEWHTKLRPNTDRIYFAVSHGRVLVGLIVEHL